MPRQLTRPLNRLSVLIYTLLAVTAITAGAHTWLRRASANAATVPAGTATTPLPDAQADQPEGETEAEIITIRPTGFEPAEITRPRGEFRLVVQNLSGLDEADLRLSVDGGQVLYEARVPLTNRDWHRTVNPPPGTYLITEAKHPGWSCRVTITSER